MLGKPTGGSRPSDLSDRLTGSKRTGIEAGLAAALIVALLMAVNPSAARAAASRTSTESTEQSFIALVPATADEFLVEARTALAERGLTSIGQLAEPGECPTALGEVSADPDHFTPLLAACCKICTVGIACGDSCISARYTCHVGGGCACNAGAPIAPPPPPRTIAIVTQNPYPTLTVNQTVEVLLVADITGPATADGIVALRVTNPAEVGVGLRGWDSLGTIAFGRAVAGSSTRFSFRGLVQGLAPGGYRLRVGFFDATGQVGPTGVYWDITVSPLTPSPSVAAVGPVVQPPAPSPPPSRASVVAMARPDSSSPAKPASDSPFGTVLIGVTIGGIAWFFYRRRRPSP